MCVYSYTLINKYRCFDKIFT